MIDSQIQQFQDLYQRIRCQQPPSYQQMQGLLCAWEQRPTNLEDHIFQYFYPIHYAIYFSNVPYFQHIYKENERSQFELMEETTLPFRRFPKSTKLLLRPGTDLLSLAIASNSVEICQILLQNTCFHSNISLDRSQCALQLAIIVENDCTLLCIQNQQFLTRQLQLDTSDKENFFHWTFLLKRLDPIRFVYNLYISNPDADQDLKILLFSTFLAQSNDSSTVLQFLDKSIDYDRLGGTKDVQLLELYAQKMQSDAAQLAIQQSLPRLQELIAAFQFANSVKALQLSASPSQVELPRKSRASHVQSKIFNVDKQIEEGNTLFDSQFQNQMMSSQAVLELEHQCQCRIHGDSPAVVDDI